MLISVTLSHTGIKPQKTLIAINGVDIMEVNTHSSQLRFVANKINKSSGKSELGIYYFEVDELNG